MFHLLFAPSKTSVIFCNRILSCPILSCFYFTNTFPVKISVFGIAFFLLFFCSVKTPQEKGKSKFLACCYFLFNCSLQFKKKKKGVIVLSSKFHLLLFYPFLLHANLPWKQVASFNCFSLLLVSQIRWHRKKVSQIFPHIFFIVSSLLCTLK